MAAASSNQKPKIWPSQRGIFSIWSEKNSQIGLKSPSPPLGVSASHLSIRRGIRSHSIENSRPYSRPAISYGVSLDNPFRFRDSNARVSFRSVTEFDTDDDDVSDVTPSSVIDRSRSRREASAKRPQSVHVPIKRVNDLKLAISRKGSVHDKTDRGITVSEERELVNRLCALALKKRKKSLKYYQDWNNKLKAESKMRINTYQPEAYKVPLNDLMLDLVKERETLLNTRLENQDPRTAVRSSSKKGRRQRVENQDLPVYCIDGIVMLGKVDDPGLFRNTFAPMSALKQSHEDPSGYERFSTISDMSGFKDDEILIHANGKYLRFDGFEFSKSPYWGMRQRKVTENVKLPHGVYPERLLIGRNSDGQFIIQEKWKF